MKYPILMLVPVLAIAFSGNTVMGDGRAEKREQKQDSRIEHGVKDGSLTTKEARKLEREQRRIEKMERRAEKDGKLSQKEKNRLEKAQDRTSGDIYKEKHDSQMKGDTRMHERNNNQKDRIKEGVKSGELTKEEASGLKQERKEIRNENAQAKSDGKLTPEERAKIENMQDNMSKDIYSEKHDGDVRTTKKDSTTVK